MAAGVVAGLVGFAAWTVVLVALTGLIRSEGVLAGLALGGALGWVGLRGRGRQAAALGAAVGAAAVAWLRELREEWTAVLDGLDDAALDRPSAYPWDAEAGLTVGHTAAWVNAELMKNAAEIGQLRLRYAAER